MGHKLTVEEQVTRTCMVSHDEALWMSEQLPQKESFRPAKEMSVLSMYCNNLNPLLYVTAKGWDDVYNWMTAMEQKYGTRMDELCFVYKQAYHHRYFSYKTNVKELKQSVRERPNFIGETFGSEKVMQAFVLK